MCYLTFIANKTGKRGDKKKLSWIYRKKIRFQKSKKSTENINNDGEEDKIPRIIVRNVPFKVGVFLFIII